MSTQEKTIYLTDLHFEHEQWVKELDFFKQEVNVFENRLAEVSSRNTATEVRQQLESFQNQFIRQKEVIDELKHKIKGHETELSNYAKDNPVAIDRVHFDDHSGLREEMNTFRTIFNELKDNFYKFVVTWL